MKQGDHVVIGPYRSDVPDVDYSTYEGHGHIIYIGERYAVVYSDAKRDEGKVPVVNVPLRQLLPDFCISVRNEVSA